MASWQDAPKVKAGGWQDAPIAKAVPNTKEARRKDAAYKAGGGVLGGLTNRLADNFTLGIADDVAGAASAISNAIVAPFSSRVDFDPVGAFNRGKGDFKDSIVRATREAPAASAISAGLGFAGSIASAIPRAAARGVQGLGQFIREGARQGAVYGTIGGVGASDGSYAERLASAGLGAASGATLGAVAPIAIKAGANTIRSVSQMAGRGRSVAPQMISDALRADGLTPRAAGRAMDAVRARGGVPMLGDAGDNATGLLASVGRQPGPSRTIVRDAVIGRQEGQADRIAGAVARDLGPVANPRAVSESLQAEAKRAADPLYEAARAAPMPITDELAAILPRIPRAAVENAQRIARIEGRDPNKLGVSFDAAGDVKLVSQPTLETLDFIKRGLDDVVEKYRDKVTGRLQLDGEGRAVNNLLRDYIRQVDRVNPLYAQARAAYAGPVRAAAALNKGGSFANKTADDITAETRDLSPFELDQYRLGVRSAMVGLIESKGDYANKVNALVGTPKKRMALERLFGGQGEFQRFLTTLGDEGRAAQTYGAVGLGSPTAPRLADDAATSDAGLIDAAGNAAVSTLSGRPVTALINAIRDATRYGQGEAGKVTRAEIAAALSETDPVILAEALRRARLSRVDIRARGRTDGRVAAAVGNTSGNLSGQFLDRLLVPAQE